MNRIEFLQLSSLITGGSLFLTPARALMPGQPLKNWAENFTFSTSNVVYPSSPGEVQQFVRKADKLKALGTRHCFNRIADSKHQLLCVRDLNKVASIDTKNHTVTVNAGIKYGELAPFLHEKGFALHNLASLPHISVGGSCSTATHGSGIGNGNLTTAVLAIELVKANGEVVNISKATDPDDFHAVAVGLGAFGIITNMTLAIQPTYMIEQRVFEQVPMAALTDNFKAIMGAGYSVSLFTDWQTEFINEVWIKSKSGTDDPIAGVKDFYGGRPAVKNVHPIIAISAENCTPQMGVPGPWHERLPHFKMGFTPSSGKELQSEYFVPIDDAPAAIAAVAKLGKQIGPHLLITEVRTIAADEFWMSPCRNQASTTIHFTWKPAWEAVRALLPKIEAALEPYQPRPHWGKLFTIPAAVLRSRYSKIDDFRQLVHQYDPTGKFRNDFLDQHIFS